MTINHIDAWKVKVGATTRPIQTSGRVVSDRSRSDHGLFGTVRACPMQVSGRVGSYLPVGRVDVLGRVFGVRSDFF